MSIFRWLFGLLSNRGEVKKLQSQLEEQRKTYEHQLQEMTADLASRTSEFEVASQKLEEKTHEVGSLTATQEELSSKVDSLGAELRDKQVEHLLEQKKSAAQLDKMRALEEQVAGLSQQVKQLENPESQIDLQNQLLFEQQRCKAIQAECDECKRQLEESSACMGKLTSVASENNSLKEQILLIENDGLHHVNATIRHELNLEQEKSAAQLDKMRALEEQVAGLSHQVKQPENLESQIDLQNQLLREKELCKAIQAECDERKRQLEESSACMGTLVLENDSLKEHILRIENDSLLQVNAIRHELNLEQKKSAVQLDKMRALVKQVVDLSQQGKQKENLESQIDLQNQLLREKELCKAIQAERDECERQLEVVKLNLEECMANRSEAVCNNHVLMEQNMFLLHKLKEKENVEQDAVADCQHCPHLQVEVSRLENELCSEKRRAQLLFLDELESSLQSLEESDDAHSDEPASME